MVNIILSDGTEIKNLTVNGTCLISDCWWTDGIKIDCGYKVYDWREME